MIFHQPGNSRGNFNYNAYTYSCTAYAPHFHMNMELILVLSGSVLVTVDGISREMTGDDVALILPGQIHSFTVPLNSKIWVAVFSEGYVPRFSTAIKDKKGRCFMIRPESAVRNLIVTKLIDREANLMTKKACFYAICDEYLTQLELEPRSAKSDVAAANILDWVSRNYTQNITLQQAAKEFGYEYHYLSRLLRRGYRINFVELLNSHRVERALELLSTTDLSVTDIMAESGFQSIRSFNLVFRAVTGCTPSGYRQRLTD